MKINWKRIGKFFKRNSHKIAAGVAGVGVVVTAVEAGKAGYRAQKRIAEVEASRNESLTTKEKVYICAEESIPAAISGAVTIASVATGAIVSEKLVVGLSAVSTSIAKQYCDYKTAVRDIDSAIDIQATEISAKSRVQNFIKQGGAVDPDCILYFDTHTGQTFNGRPGIVTRAEARLRDRLAHLGQFSENDYRYSLGELADPIGGDLYGWDQFSFMDQNTDDPGLMIDEEVHYTDDGLEFHVLTISNEPDADFIGGSYSSVSFPFDVR